MLNITMISYAISFIIWHVVQELCSTDPTQERCARSYRSYISRPAIRSIGHTDHIDQGSVCSEKHTSHRSIAVRSARRVYSSRNPFITARYIPIYFHVMYPQRCFVLYLGDRTLFIALVIRFHQNRLLSEVYQPLFYQASNLAGGKTTMVGAPSTAACVSSAKSIPLSFQVVNTSEISDPCS